MDAIKETFAQLKESWQKVYESMLAAPEAWKPHLPYSSPAEINEVILAISILLDRLRAPNGFTPTFRLIRGFSHTALNSAMTSCKALESGQYTNFPIFLASLNQILSAVQSMLYFSDHDESRIAIESLGGKLAESLSLLGTAQSELAKKAELLDSLKTISEDAETRATAIEEAQEKGEIANTSIQSLKTEADKSSASLKVTLEEIESDKEELEQLLKTAGELHTKINSQIVDLEKLHKRSSDLNDVALALLPTAASAGLAAAFSSRVRQLNPTKYTWMFSFMFSIAGLAFMAYLILTSGQHQSAELWQAVLQRLPFTAPFIWLGWFSAVQYGNTIRVQEDYAFKEATAKAFVGYKDHMNHLADLNLEDAKTALQRLATKTIDILSHEPLRIYQRSSDDVSPTKTIFDSVKLNAKPKSE